MLQLMTGYDSSDDKSPEQIALIALAAFSTSYNLPVYLYYNITYRRAFVRMLRCQVMIHGEDGDWACSARPATVIGSRNTATGGGGRRAVDDRSGGCRQATRGRVPQDNDVPGPSTSQDRTPGVLCPRRANTPQSDDAQRY